MNVFLDTNVFLSFYQLTSDDLEELKKLAVLARQGKIRLLIPTQVVEEFRRNREAAIAEALRRLREQRRSLHLPQLARQYPEFAELAKTQKLLLRTLDQLIDRIERDALAKTLEADSIIEELFAVGETIPITAKDVRRADLRVGTGSPPGKKGSLGDALNWEALLRHVRRGQELHFVSDDGDFYSPLAASYLHEYLRHEWKETNGSEIHPYTRLSSFFAQHFPDIRLASELEKDLLIRELAEAPTFSHVHRAISGLSRYTRFTREQVNGIVAAAITNNQVYWIAQDPDVRDFLQNLVHGREDIIEPVNIPKIRFLLDEIEPFAEIPS
ncbi:MAG: PIN domain-containing protein [Anaerolineales bacterium]